MVRRLAIAAAALCGLAFSGQSMAGLHAGDVAPDFRGTDLDGVSHTLSEFRGKVVVLFVLAYF